MKESSFIMVDAIVVGVIVVLCVLILGRKVKNLKEGKSSCGCGCSSCPQGEMCHSKEK